ncbi:MAG: tetratricopeptide repeat protein, partial [Candidatus Omnitrophica bacterium]|nr:tetratricopeptide repeat protein [Candidatus Omnitrophota bacterium]
YESIDASRGGLDYSLYNFKKGYLYLYYFKDYQASFEMYNSIKQQIYTNSIADYIKTDIFKRISIYYCKAGFILILNNKYEEALDNFTCSLKIDPNNGLPYIGMAISYLKLGVKDKALELGIEAKRIALQDLNVLINLGYIYTYLNMFDEAIQEYKYCISIFPRDARSYYNLSYVYIMKGEWDLALKYLQKAITLKPRFKEAYNNIGYIYWHKGNFYDAILFFKKAIELKQDFLPSRFNLAMALVVMGRYTEAREELYNILKYDPNNETVKLNIKEIERIISQQ